MIFFLYNLVLTIFFPLVIITITLRSSLGKEDKHRYLEKFGIYNKKKVNNKNLIWFHACSVGEAKSIFSLINFFLKNNHNILITSNTKMSSIYIKENLPKNVTHQFLPIDYQFAVKRFINFWNPRIGIFVESEIWPNLIKLSKKRRIPLCLIQASFSKKSIRKWAFFSDFFKSLMKNFNFIIAQSYEDKNRITKAFDIEVVKVLNLKLSSVKLPVNIKDTIKIKKKLKGFKVISALSTHSGEEKILLNAFSKIKKSLDKIILFIQPRHPHRKKEIIRIIKEKNLTYKVRSKLEVPNKNTDVYLYDTFGESGNIISISEIIILGGTLIPIGGHNLVEPAQFGKCIIVGNYYYKIQELVNLFLSKKAIFVSEDYKLDIIIKTLLSDSNTVKNTGNNAKRIIAQSHNPEKYLYKKIMLLIKKNENPGILV